MTRAADRAAGEVALIEELGGEALLAPTIRIVEPSDGGAALSAARSSLVSATARRRPDWLPADGNNPHGVDPSQRWKPLLTFFDTMKMVFTTANKERAGVFTDHGHDYRKELPQLLRTALGFDGTVSDAQLARITEQVRQ